LYGKDLLIFGWIPGHDDFILFLPAEARYAYVHLTWNKETDPKFPYCELFDGIEDVNDFFAQKESD